MSKRTGEHEVEVALPAERAASWVAAASATGAVLGYLLWGIFNYLFPDLDLRLDKCMLHGTGLLGTFALTWVVASHV